MREIEVLRGHNSDVRAQSMNCTHSQSPLARSMLCSCCLRAGVFIGLASTPRATLAERRIQRIPHLLVGGTQPGNVALCPTLYYSKTHDDATSLPTIPIISLLVSFVSRPHTRLSRTPIASPSTSSRGILRDTVSALPPMTASSNFGLARHLVRDSRPRSRSSRIIPKLPMVHSRLEHRQ